MRRNLIVPRLFLVMIMCMQVGWAQSQIEAPSGRHSVFISVLHMGIGRDSDGHWFATEDFRWPVALSHFLKYIAEQSNNNTDLVIAGDFLELWQPPQDITCEGVNTDYGCTEAEMIAIVTAVIDAHASELQDFARFSSLGKNCIHLVPGNHDAALLIPSIWAPVESALRAEGGCVKFVKSGVWVSSDGKIIAEHGHQIGWDPNKYSDWPSITKMIDGTTYVRRPWGEQFVQKLFNEEERQYPLIDNLSPSSAGARHRMGDRGIIGSAGDLARFLKFNLLETSLSQKIRVLEEERRDGDEPRWDIKQARSLGHELILYALPPGDELAELISAEDVLKRELDALVRDEAALPDEQINALCDQLAQRQHERFCRQPLLGGFIESAVSSRKRVVRPHVKDRWRKERRARTFVYGHTHAFETEWGAKMNSLVSVMVLNDGAFQRVVDDGKFSDIAKTTGMSPGQAMRSLALDQLPACYTFVRIIYEDGMPNRELYAWFMPESAKEGKVVDVCDSRCADVGHGCP